MWLVPRDKPFVVIRQQAEVRADSSAYFSSDRTKCPIGPRWADGKYHNCAATQVRTEPSRPATSPPNALWHSCSQVGEVRRTTARCVDRCAGRRARRQKTLHPRGGTPANNPLACFVGVSGRERTPLPRHQKTKETTKELRRVFHPFHFGD